MEFQELLTKRRHYIPDIQLIAFDPGETTGVAFFRGGSLLNVMQLKTNDIEKSAYLLQDTITNFGPNIVIMEDYKVYGWKAKQHSWASLHTPQLIGLIRSICALQGIPCELRMAVDVKAFCTDTRLIEWGMYKEGLRHGRDAIRHGCYAYLFSKHPIFQQPVQPQYLLRKGNENGTEETSNSSGDSATEG